jgi:hypothetical protein
MSTNTRFTLVLMLRWSLIETKKGGRRQAEAITSHSQHEEVVDDSSLLEIGGC